jgi:hypothetical protein
MVYPSALRTDVASVDRPSMRQSRYGCRGYDEDDDGRPSFSWSVNHLQAAPKTDALVPSGNEVDVTLDARINLK